MRRFTAVVAIIVLAAMAGATVAAAAMPKLKRHEDRYWTWYAPAGWVAAQSRAGIDISSPTGVLHVGYGFSGTAFPVSHEEVRDYLVQSGGLDVHPLRNVNFLRTGSPFRFAGGQREISQWSAFRSDRRERTRGTLKVDVFNDYSSGSFGFASSVYSAPKRKWKSQKGLLNRLLGLIFYRPQTPDFAAAPRP
jgi:hypothetical protein